MRIFPILGGLPTWEFFPHNTVFISEGVPKYLIFCCPPAPAQRHPANQQGGGGRWKPGWRSLGEVGGWRLSTIFLFSTRRLSMWCCEVHSAATPPTFCLEEVEGSGVDPSVNIAYPDCWGFHFHISRKWKFCYHICICLLPFSRMSVLDTVWRTKVLVQFNKFKYVSLLLQSKNNKPKSFQMSFSLIFQFKESQFLLRIVAEYIGDVIFFWSAPKNFKK